MQVIPYLDLNNLCEQALDFYRNAVDARVESIARWKDAPEGQRFGPPEGIMHASVRFGDSLVHVSDGYGDGRSGSHAGVRLLIDVATVHEAQRTFEALSEGGEVTMPLQKTFWAESFGMFRDRFGVQWTVSCNH